MAAFLGTGNGESPAANPIPQEIDLGRLRTLVDFFPIGKKLTYFPEYKREIVFDTLVIAYGVNGQLIYSGDAIERDADGDPTSFRTEANARIPVSALTSFQILVPDTTDLEMKLDYHRRALIGRGKQFIKGNVISLISRGRTRGMGTIDTIVAKRVMLKDGPYANTKLILLTPELPSIAVTDQRKKARAKTNVPVRLFVLKGKSSGTYTIADISDHAVGVRTGDRDPAMPPMNSGDEVILDIDLGKAKGHYVIKGSVFRRSPENCIIRMEGPFRDGKLGRFSALDLLELKAGLLNYAG